MPIVGSALSPRCEARKAWNAPLLGSAMQEDASLSNRQPPQDCMDPIIGMRHVIQARRQSVAEFLAE